MAHNTIWELNHGQGDVRESLQESFCGWSGRGFLGILFVQANQRLASLLKRPTHDELDEGQ